MRLLQLLMITAFAAAPAAAQIFKTVDEDGNVVYSDTPPHTQDENAAPAEPVDLPTINQLPPTRIEFEIEEQLTEEELEAATNYSGLTIVSPAANETVRDNAGNVSVVAVMTPALRSGHRLQLIMNNEVVETIRTGSRFDLRYVDRGTHEVTVRIVDDRGTELARSPSSVFHLQRFFRR